MPVNLAAIRDLLRPGLWGISGKYPDIERQWPTIFKKTNSTMALERRAAVKLVGLAQLKTEGAPTSFDNSAGQLYVYNSEHQEVGLGYAMTRKSLDDNLYKSDFGPSNDGLVKSFIQAEEMFGADVFNSGTTYVGATGGDGKALFDTAHPIPGATIANKPTVEVDLNETSLLNAATTIRTTWKDNSNMKMYARGEKLLIHPALEPVAIRLYRSELRPGSATNDVNAVKHMNDSLKQNYFVWDYLTSSFAWFLTTNVDGLVMFDRRPFELDMSVEFTTDNLLVKGYQRYSFAYYDWRCAWGTFPTA